MRNLVSASRSSGAAFFVALVAVSLMSDVGVCAEALEQGAPTLEAAVSSALDSQPQDFQKNHHNGDATRGSQKADKRQALAKPQVIAQRSKSAAEQRADDRMTKVLSLTKKRKKGCNQDARAAEKCEGRWGWRQGSRKSSAKFMPKANSKCIPASFFKYGGEIRQETFEVCETSDACRVKHESCSMGAASGKKQDRDPKMMLGVGNDFGCGVTKGGSVHCWGTFDRIAKHWPLKTKETAYYWKQNKVSLDAWKGGDKEFPAAWKLMLASANTDKADRLAVGPNQVCVLFTPSHKIKCFGSATSTEDQKMLQIPTDIRWQDVSTSTNSTCAISKEGNTGMGKLYCVGSDRWKKASRAPPFCDINCVEFVKRFRKEVTTNQVEGAFRNALVSSGVRNIRGAVGKILKSIAHTSGKYTLEFGNASNPLGECGGSNITKGTNEAIFRERFERYLASPASPWSGAKHGCSVSDGRLKRPCAQVLLEGCVGDHCVTSKRTPASERASKQRTCVKIWRRYQERKEIVTKRSLKAGTAKCRKTLTKNFPKSNKLIGKIDNCIKAWSTELTHTDWMKSSRKCTENCEFPELKKQAYRETYSYLFSQTRAAFTAGLKRHRSRLEATVSRVESLGDGTRWSTVSVGVECACATTSGLAKGNSKLSQGNLWCWGIQGEPGAHRCTPPAMASFEFMPWFKSKQLWWRQVSVGFKHVCGALCEHIAIKKGQPHCHKWGTYCFSHGKLVWGDLFKTTLKRLEKTAGAFKCNDPHEGGFCKGVSERYKKARMREEQNRAMRCRESRYKWLPMCKSAASTTMTLSLGEGRGTDDEDEEEPVDKDEVDEHAQDLVLKPSDKTDMRKKSTNAEKAEHTAAAAAQDAKNAKLRFEQAEKTQKKLKKESENAQTKSKKEAEALKTAKQREAESREDEKRNKWKTIEKKRKKNGKDYLGLGLPAQPLSIAAGEGRTCAVFYNNKKKLSTVDCWQAHPFVQDARSICLYKGRTPASFFSKLRRCGAPCSCHQSSTCPGLCAKGRTRPLPSYVPWRGGRYTPKKIVSASYRQCDLPFPRFRKIVSERRESKMLDEWKYPFSYVGGRKCAYFEKGMTGPIVRHRIGEYEVFGVRTRRDYGENFNSTFDVHPMKAPWRKQLNAAWRKKNRKQSIAEMLSSKKGRRQLQNDLSGWMASGRRRSGRRRRGRVQREIWGKATPRPSWPLRPSEYCQHALFECSERAMDRTAKKTGWTPRKWDPPPQKWEPAKQGGWKNPDGPTCTKRVMDEQVAKHVRDMYCPRGAKRCTGRITYRMQSYGRCPRQQLLSRAACQTWANQQEDLLGRQTNVTVIPTEELHEFLGGGRGWSRHWSEYEPDRTNERLRVYHPDNFQEEEKQPRFGRAEVGYRWWRFIEPWARRSRAFVTYSKSYLHASSKHEREAHDSKFGLRRRRNSDRRQYPPGCFIRRNPGSRSYTAFYNDNVNSAFKCSKTYGCLCMKPTRILPPNAGTQLPLMQVKDNGYCQNLRLKGKTSTSGSQQGHIDSLYADTEVSDAGRITEAQCAAFARMRGYRFKKTKGGWSTPRCSIVSLNLPDKSGKLTFQVEYNLNELGRGAKRGPAPWMKRFAAGSPEVAKCTQERNCVCAVPAAALGCMRFNAATGSLVPIPIATPDGFAKEFNKLKTRLQHCRRRDPVRRRRDVTSRRRNMPHFDTEIAEWQPDARSCNLLSYQLTRLHPSELSTMIQNRVWKAEDAKNGVRGLPAVCPTYLVRDEATKTTYTAGYEDRLQHDTWPKLVELKKVSALQRRSASKLDLLAATLTPTRPMLYQQSFSRFPRSGGRRAGAERTGYESNRVRMLRSGYGSPLARKFFPPVVAPHIRKPETDNPIQNWAGFAFYLSSGYQWNKRRPANQNGRPKWAKKWPAPEFKALGHRGKNSPYSAGYVMRMQANQFGPVRCPDLGSHRGHGKCFSTAGHALWVDHTGSLVTFSHRRRYRSFSWRAPGLKLDSSGRPRDDSWAAAPIYPIYRRDMEVRAYQLANPTAARAAEDYWRQRIRLASVSGDEDMTLQFTQRGSASPSTRQGYARRYEPRDVHVYTVDTYHMARYAKTASYPGVKGPRVTKGETWGSGKGFSFDRDWITLMNLFPARNGNANDGASRIVNVCEDQGGRGKCRGMPVTPLPRNSSDLRATWVKHHLVSDGRPCSQATDSRTYITTERNIRMAFQPRPYRDAHNTTHLIRDTPRAMCQDYAAKKGLAFKTHKTHKGVPDGCYIAKENGASVVNFNTYNLPDRPDAAAQRPGVRMHKKYLDQSVYDPAGTPGARCNENNVCICSSFGPSVYYVVTSDPWVRNMLEKLSTQRVRNNKQCAHCFTHVATIRKEDRDLMSTVSPGLASAKNEALGVITEDLRAWSARSSCLQQNTLDPSLGNPMGIGIGEPRKDAVKATCPSLLPARDKRNAKYADDVTSVRGEAKHQDMRQIALGTSNSCVLSKRGEILCWGRDRVCKTTKGQCLQCPTSAPASRGAFKNQKFVEKWNSKTCTAKPGFTFSQHLLLQGICAFNANQTTEENIMRFQPPAVNGKTQDLWGPNECHPSCKTCMPGNSAATACTSCHGKPPSPPGARCRGKACYHTIVNPKANAGMCSFDFCRFCKPRTCCGPHHKHFIIDPDKMQGVCVRHTNDCTPLCSTSKQTGKQVCSKGCNNLVKDMNTKLSICQANKLVVCMKPEEALGEASAAKGKTGKIPKTIALIKKPNGTPVKTCDVQKTVDCKASCAKLTDEEFGDLFAAGATCILGILEMRRCNKNAQKKCASASEKEQKVAKVKCATTDNCAHVSSAVSVIIRSKCKLKCTGSAAKKCEEVALPY